MKGVFVFLIGAGCVVYLLAPSLLPDAIPIIGALDEVTATTILLSCFAYFGIDLTKLFKRGKKGPKEVDGEVIDVETERE